MKTDDSAIEYVLHVTRNTRAAGGQAAPVWQLHETTPSLPHARRMAAFLNALEEVAQVAITKARKNPDGTLTPVSNPKRLRKNPLRMAWMRLAGTLYKTKPRGISRAVSF